MSDLHVFDVYGCKEDDVIAESIEDARSIMLELVDEADLENAVFRQYDDGALFRCREDEGEPFQVLPCSEWIAKFGRGYFCSTEW